MRYLITLLALGLTTLALAHNEQTVGSGDSAATVSLAMNSEPAYTSALNGLQLHIQDQAGNGLENLEKSLSATLVAPDGSAERDLTLRPVSGEPGTYTDDFVLTEPGVYSVRVGGFIGDTEVDLTFETHEVAPLADLRFP